MQAIKQMSVLMMTNRGGHAVLMGEHGFPQEEDLWELIMEHQIYVEKAERGKTWRRTCVYHPVTTVSLQTNDVTAAQCTLPGGLFMPMALTCVQSLRRV